jgi:hypothetical protein
LAGRFASRARAIAFFRVNLIVEGLGKHGDGPGGQRLAADEVVAVSGDDHRAQIGIRPGQSALDLEPVHVGQAQIEHHARRTVVAAGRQDVRSIREAPRPQAQRLGQTLESTAQRWIVVHDEHDAERRVHGRAIPAAPGAAGTSDLGRGDLRRRA